MIRHPTSVQRFVVLSASVALALGSLVRTAEKPKLGGNGTLIVGSYPSQYWIIDEATEKIVGTIPFKSGIPRRTVISRDRKRFYTVDATMEKVEILDIAARKTVDTFTLTDGNKKVRIRSLEPDPLQRFAIMLIMPATKLIDRVEIGDPTLIQYDLAQHKIVRSIPWPNDFVGYGANIQFAPDGKLMYLFTGQDVLIYDMDTLTQVDKWALALAVQEGTGRVEFGSSDVFNDEPGFYTALFTVADPVQHRRTMGIGRVNLAAKSVDFYPLGPAIPPDVRGSAGEPFSFAMVPGRKFAYGLYQDMYRFEFWKFDLEHHKLAARTEFKGRPRMALKPSSNGKLLYIYQAGNTIDVYDADTYQRLRTITLDGDMTTDLFVFPVPPVTPTPSTQEGGGAWR